HASIIKTKTHSQNIFFTVSQSIHDFIEDDVIESPVDYTNRILLREQLDEVMDTLTDREENVLRMRFGLDDGRM
ncbi:hypothetical protein ACI3PF_22125, partial [Lactococcus lactis]